MAGRKAVIPTNDKQRIYDAFVRGEDYLHFADQLNIKRQTAYFIVRRAESRDGTNALFTRWCQRSSKADDEMKVILRLLHSCIVLDHPAYKLQQ